MPDIRILRVFPRRTSMTPDDALVRIGPPGLYDIRVGRAQPELDADEIHVSCCFTWDRRLCADLAQTWELAQPGLPVLIGGPGWPSENGPADGEFVPGRYVRDGVTFTSRGCPNKCPWCLVPAREGALHELPIQPGHIVQDNNLLACSRKHFEQVCGMLAAQKRAAKFAGGFEAARLRPWHVELLRQLRIEEVWLASDGPTLTAGFRQAVSKLRSFLPLRKVRAYVMIGYKDEGVRYAEDRLLEVYHAGALPFAQIYRPPEGSPPWQLADRTMRLLARKWSRPAAIFANYPEADHG